MARPQPLSDAGRGLGLTRHVLLHLKRPTIQPRFEWGKSTGDEERDNAKRILVNPLTNQLIVSVECDCTSLVIRHLFVHSGADGAFHGSP